MYGGAKHGAFQKYTTCREVVVAKIPDNLPFAEAVVLPLALSTSMVALFELLQLALPSTESRSTGKSVLVWGGSSSIGSIAIQLVAAAGYKVITTASAKNHEYVKALGATAVFDHSDPNVTSLLIEALKGSDCAGVYDCIGTDERGSASNRDLAVAGQFAAEREACPGYVWAPRVLGRNFADLLHQFTPRIPAWWRTT